MSTILDDATFQALAGLLKSRSGLVIGPEKAYLLQTRLTPILRREGIADLAGLVARLRVPGAIGLVQQVVEAMTTNESFFFRDDKPFHHFRAQALPKLIAARGPTATLRVWSAAASSGQEAYSLAMILHEARAALGHRQVEILGTDIAREQLARAREGLYSQFEVQRGLPMQMLVKYFRKEADGWRVNDTLRGMAHFREFNLLSDLRGLGTFDIVFCRNVLIYFDPPTKTRVLEAIARQTAPDGLLYLGGAETVMGISTSFAAVPGERGVYAPVGAARADRRLQAAGV